MNWEIIVIGVLFIMAVLYIISKFYNPFTKGDKNNSCGKGCGCGSSGIDKLKNKP